ncbi:MAG: NUMOD4 domain-containing protein [Bacteroidota bacterium]
MFRNYPGEKWEPIDVDHKLRYNYAISNYGRLVSYSEAIKDGRIIKPGKVEGYTTFRYKLYAGAKIRYFSKMIHNLVAEKFLDKPTTEHNYVIHLDRNKSNNYYKNLKWVTREESIQFKKESPAVKEAMRKLVELNKKRDGAKLTESKVRLLKKKIFDPNRKTRLKMLAKQFGISEMQLYRIKSGENWGHVKIDD